MQKNGSRFWKDKIIATVKKEIEYGLSKSRLVNYSFDNKLPVINLDALGGETWWTMAVE